MRRLEARRQRSEERGSAWRRQLSAISPIVVLVWIGFFLANAGILLSGGDSVRYSLGETVHQDITARVDFTVENQARTRQERQVARASAPDVFVVNNAPIEAIGSRLAELLNIAKASADDAALKAKAEEKGWKIDDAGAKLLREYATDEKSQYSALVAQLIGRLKNEYIVEAPSGALRTELPRTSMLKRGDEPGIEITTTTLQCVTYATYPEYIQQRARQLAGEVFPPALKEPVATIIGRALTPPSSAADPGSYALWRYDEALTKKTMDEAEQQVQVSMTEYKKGSVLVRTGTVLSREELNLLVRENEEFLAQQRTVPALRRQWLSNQVGIAGLALIVTLGLASYTLAYQDRIFQKPARALGLASLLALMVGLSRLNETLQHPWNVPVEFSVAFVVMAAILLAIAYNRRFAFGVCCALSILVTLASRSDLGLFVTLMSATGVAVLSLNEIRTRSKIIAIGAASGAAAFLASSFSSLMSGEELKYVVAHGLAAAAAALGAGFVVQGILHYFERLFGVATSLTLLEWCDANRPLLRKLAQEAPGTYSHSLILSQMAEEAAAAIGANGLLARVGALYHDIGKTLKSYYFVENQEARMNRHDRLAPTMSLLIIVGHVKDGIELARAYGLPRVLHQFIAEHHGTTVVKYFHHAAKEAAAGNIRTKGRTDREVSESEFRYPGPKPHSRESAILMICDSCEGAVRALSEPTPGRIEALIHQMIMDRLNDGQLDDCEITLRELNLVEQSLVKSLCAIHHGRIKYPKGGPERAKPAVEDDSRVVDREPKEAAAGEPSPAPEVARQT